MRRTSRSSRGSPTARRPSGTIVLDFDDAGHLLGVEVLGATELLTDAARARLTDIADIV
ncbi:uncharacterized protein YuzE [Naumannella cuiyingiana]|uniref:Uncharacterized protein YuzE n=1 Tax=Naumannella cuiyingiana TaxID=1347891 RepID=A0A7Z0IKR4_9ACTN|nr:DUF2283 domain-containing protein [Naumannella cuiyingiana]NYI70806.1 uncharacterized protein YuzE [Naumannella cuiyingiana]